MGKKNKNQSESRNKPSSAKSKSSKSIGKWIMFPVFIGLISYFLYQKISIYPKVPSQNMDLWWGSFPLDPKKDVSIRPFKVEFSDVIVNDLRERLLHRHRFMDPIDGAGFLYGFNSIFLTQVLDYWQNKYNFKDREVYFNKYNHYKTNIQGLDLHFMQVKPKVSPDVEVIPLLLLHGWPGSFREFYDVIPMLTTVNTKFEKTKNFVFEVIVPSLPGFGYSQGPARPNLGPLEMAVVIRNLMKRIGYERYYVQGGSVGHVVGSAMATLFPEEVLGFHTNFPVTIGSTMGTALTVLGSLWPNMIVESELQDRMYPLKNTIARYFEETGYLHIQATKPDTIGIALSDSPAGLAAYILEKFSSWTNREFSKYLDGRLLDKYQLTHLLDNVMVYWATNSITTSFRMYAEFYNQRTIALRLDDIPVEVPTWGLKFKHDIFFTPDMILKLKYKNYIHSTMVQDGGHFGAFEMPEIFARDVFDAVSTFKEYHAVKNNVKSTESTKTVYDFIVKDLKGQDVKLNRYKGKLLLIVNVASQCRLTDTNYDQLNSLHEKYAAKGLSILAFPCNQFGDQEPGSPEDIFKFTKHRGVKFDVFGKVDVNGDDTSPLWEYLKNSQSGTLGNFIKWNFSKFIVDRNGIPVERFAPTTNPADLDKYIMKYL